MIQCSNCQTAQFLHIIESRAVFTGDTIGKITEDYKCTMCGNSGQQVTADGDAVLRGGVVETKDKPVMSA